MKKTLLITNDFSPTASGIATVFYQIWRQLETSDHWILTPRIKGAKEFDRDNNLKIIRHPALPGKYPLAKILNLLIQLAYAKILILFCGIKLIHAGQIWTSGTIAVLLKTFFRTPYFLWVYGGETTSVYLKGVFSTFWAKSLLKGADKIITNSNFCQREFLDYGFNPEKCFIILPGVEVNIFTPGKPPEMLSEKWNPEGKKVLLTVARISERKGHDLVIRALPQILKAYPTTLYLIVGTGPDTERLKRLAEDLKVAEYLKFTGYISDRELPDYYRLCDIYVMPNRETFDTTDSVEGFGISFVEASACGKPVIGGKSGGAIEAVADGISGYLVDPESVGEFTEKVIMLMQDDILRNRIGEQGRLRALKEMNWDSRAEKLLALENNQCH